MKIVNHNQKAQKTLSFVMGFGSAQPEVIGAKKKRGSNFHPKRKKK